ncbi:LacI family DNA-binding transcriptional regulator [Nioella aestuarii]|uniref:LacI family DNA-binding transcriptional regulator n=1 Tax=Nioella aestuarii TaxID=1662864 RepID=UPI003D7FC58F
MTVTLKDVAERAGVSRSAVSRTFTPGASVSAKTRAKVERAAAELGYAPSALASGLSTGRTKLIGLVSNNFRNPIFLEVFDLFTRAIQDRGLRPLLVNLSDDTDPDAAIRMLRQYSVDAVIVASSTLSPAFAVDCSAAGLPVVHAFGRATDQLQVPVVGIDNVEAGRMAARALLARGYRDIGFLGGPAGATTTQDRLEGLRRELSGHAGIRLRESFAGGYSHDAGAREMARLITEEPLADAYFCGDDVVAIGALSALRAAGREVPHDVGLIGFNDMEAASWGLVNLTTIRQPLDAIIVASVEMAITLSEQSGSAPMSTLLPLTLVERGTLRPEV